MYVSQKQSIRYVQYIHKVSTDANNANADAAFQDTNILYIFIDKNRRTARQTGKTSQPASAAEGLLLIILC